MIVTLFKKCLWLSGLGSLLLGYAVLVEPAQLKIRHVELVSDKYAGPDIRIGIITDIHIGGMHVPPKRVETLVEKMNALSPDFILLPGDFVSGHISRKNKSESFNEKIEQGLGNLESLTAPTFAAIGNHDAYWDADYVETRLNDAGVVVLRNEAYALDGVCLVGLADALTARPDKAAYKDCDPSTPPIAFTHSPDAWRTFRSDSVLVVAGHTHGGQVNLPFIGRRVNSISLGPEHSYGFSEIYGVDMFVSAGVGTSILPIRFRAPPEIVILTLRAKTR